jgi:hypothetical protein
MSIYIEKRLDAVIELLVLLVNQMEAQADYQRSIHNGLVQDNNDFQDFGKIFRPKSELLAEVAKAVEEVKRD